MKTKLYAFAICASMFCTGNVWGAQFCPNVPKNYKPGDPLSGGFGTWRFGGYMKSRSGESGYTTDMKNPSNGDTGNYTLRWTYLYKPELNGNEKRTVCYYSNPDNNRGVLRLRVNNDDPKLNTDNYELTPSRPYHNKGQRCVPKNGDIANCQIQKKKT